MPTSPLPRTATYKPRIVWGYGTTTDTSEFDDVRRFYLNSPGLQVDGIGRDQERSYGPPKAPSFDLTLSNHDGRFSPGGPLALFLGRGPAVSLDADWGMDILVDADDVTVDDTRALVDGTVTHHLFTGTAVDMPQQISRGQRTVGVTAIGRLQSLVAVKPTTLLYESIRTDEAVTVLLDAAGWPEEDRILDTGDTTLLYWWLNSQTTAMAALNAILSAEGPGSCAYEDGDGVFHFEGRQYRDNAERSQTIQWAFFDGPTQAGATVDSDEVTVDSPEVLVDGVVPNALLHILPAEYRSNPDEVVVSVAAQVNTRTPTTAPVKVWEYGGPLVLGPAEVRDIQVPGSEPFRDAITPRLDTDYKIAAGTLSGVSLLTTSGQTVTLRITAGVGGATVHGVTSEGPQVRATSVPVVSTQTVLSTVDTALASARQGNPNNPLVLDAWAEVEPNQMLDIVNSMALRYQRERRQVVFRFQNIDAIHQYAAFDIRPSDRVQFVHGHAGLNAHFFVETVHYDVSPGGGLLTVTVGAEQVFDLSGGKFDFAKYDTDVYGL